MQVEKAPEMTRYVELNDWIFEIKSIRAIKVGNYGEPYKATANICVNNDVAHVDGVMSKDQSDLKKEDLDTFKALCLKLGISNVQFDTFDNQNVFETLRNAKELDLEHVKTA